MSIENNFNAKDSSAGNEDLLKKGEIKNNNEEHDPFKPTEMWGWETVDQEGDIKGSVDFSGLKKELTSPSKNEEKSAPSVVEEVKEKEYAVKKVVEKKKNTLKKTRTKTKTKNEVVPEDRETIDDLQKQIAELQKTIAELQKIIVELRMQKNGNPTIVNNIDNTNTLVVPRGEDNNRADESDRRKNESYKEDDAGGEENREKSESDENREDEDAHKKENTFDDDKIIPPPPIPPTPEDVDFESLDSVEQDLITARIRYIDEHQAFMDSRIDKTKEPKEGDMPPSLTEAKDEYDALKIKFGHALMKNRERDLIEAGYTDESLQEELQRYKTTEVYDRIIIQEHNILCPCWAESWKPAYKKISEKIFCWYNGQPKIKKIAIGALIATGGFAASGGLSLPATALFAGSYFARALLGIGIGMAAGKAFDTVIKDKSGEKFQDSLQQLRSDFELNGNKRGFAEEQYREILKTQEKNKNKHTTCKGLVIFAASMLTGLGLSSLENSFSNIDFNNAKFIPDNNGNVVIDKGPELPPSPPAESLPATPDAAPAENLTDASTVPDSDSAEQIANQLENTREFRKGVKQSLLDRVFGRGRYTVGVAGITPEATVPPVAENIPTENIVIENTNIETVTKDINTGSESEHILSHRDYHKELYKRLGMRRRF